MDINQFDYKLPKKLISQKLTLPRDRCNFLIYNSEKRESYFKKFYHVLDYLGKDDVVVLNDTKVFPARLEGEKTTGGKIEVFLIKPIDGNFQKKVKNKWEILVNKKVEDSQEILFKKKNKIVLKGIIKKDQSLLMGFNLKGEALWKAIYDLGNMPLPPYIKSQKDQKHYQTIYAKKVGSCAAPTAGFHFTENLIEKLLKKGVKIEYITLNVGLGTFKPIRVDDIKKHKMDTEYLKVEKDVAKRLTNYKKQGKRIIAVGTTVVRTLESVFKKGVFCDDVLQTNIFIYPGYKFKVVDAFITNFHLPRSTPLMMTAGFLMQKHGDFETAKKELFKIYNSAVAKKYKFYSFGDAMMII